jgi:hypothetical protein
MSGSKSFSNSSTNTGVPLADLQSDLSEFVALLNSHRVEYVVVGGYAVAFHGHPRFTGDVDFFVRPTSENAQRVIEVLHAFGFGSLPVSSSDLTVPDRIVQLGRPPNRIDLLTSISGVTFDEAWASRVHGKLGSHSVPFIGCDALLQNKAASGRDKDNADVAKLRAIIAKRTTDTV